MLLCKSGSAGQKAEPQWMACFKLHPVTCWAFCSARAACVLTLWWAITNIGYVAVPGFVRRLTRTTACFPSVRLFCALHGAAPSTAAGPALAPGAWTCELSQHQPGHLRRYEGQIATDGSWSCWFSAHRQAGWPTVPQGREKPLDAR